MGKDSRVKDVGEVRTALLFDIIVDLQPRLPFGAGPIGQRVLFGSKGGVFEGPEVRGKVLAGGGDWALFRADGVMHLDVRLTLQTDDGALILMTYGGRWWNPPELQAEMADPIGRYVVDPARYYFRTNPLFETGDARYGWMNNLVAVGAGYLVEGGVAYRISRVL